MIPPRTYLFLIVATPLFFGCSDSAESTIDDLAEKSKELVGNAREMSEDASKHVKGELDAAREKASERIDESIERLREN